jgi:hypothetical protein
MNAAYNMDVRALALLGDARHQILVDGNFRAADGTEALSLAVKAVGAAGDVEEALGFFGRRENF